MSDSGNAKHTLRIIAGEWRSRRLPVADIDGLRPTSDRVRESLFNWLQHDIRNARCLDLFAGSGALGLEAASRGANKVVMIEQNTTAISALRDIAQSLSADNLDILHADALGWIEMITLPFDIVFLDPPFDQQLLPETIELLSRSKAVKKGSQIYIEQAVSDEELNLPKKWQITKQGKTRQVRYSLVKIS